VRARGFAPRLLAWYDAHKEARALPWRDARDPWATWVSEVMLQQTRAEVVREAYHRFLGRYPTPAAWAAASDVEMFAAWRGLGYYRRARLLREGARAVASRHGGRVPADPASIAELPGIGPYTAGAIASIAFGRPVPAIDGNVERVIARHRGIEVAVKTAAGARAVRAAVASVLPGERPGDFNQALMDLGATLCTPRSPRCDACPVGRDCVARRHRRQADLPVLPRPRATVEVRTRVALVHLPDGRLLGQRVRPGMVNAGQVDLPGPGPLLPVEDPDELQAWLAGRLGRGAVRVDPEPACEVRHGITHHRIVVAVHRGALAIRHVPAGYLLAPARDPGTPWTTLARKAVARAALA
jgi:A/G-specific adenine glycosylase